MLVTQNMGGQKEFFTSDEQTMINPDCMDLRIADEFSKKLGYESHVNKLHIGDAKKFKIAGPLKLSEEYLNETLQMHSTKKNNPKWWDESVNYRYYHDPDFRAAMCMTMDWVSNYKIWPFVIDVSEATNLDEVILDMYPEFKRANTAMVGIMMVLLIYQNRIMCTWMTKKHLDIHYAIGDNANRRTWISTDYKEYNKWQDVKELTKEDNESNEKSGNNIVRQFVDEWWKRLQRRNNIRS